MDVDSTAMAFGLLIRTIDGRMAELAAADDGHFREPRDVVVETELDTQELWALPGLADCHAHLASSSHDDESSEQSPLENATRNAWAQLEAGVFLVADKGTGDEVSLQIMDQPPLRRPDLHMAGKVITCVGGYTADYATEVDEADLMDAVSVVANGDATWVKLIGDWPRKGGPAPTFSEEGYASAVRIAHEAGARVAIHTCAPETATLAVNAGVDSIEHGLFLTADDVERLGARNGAWVPTIMAMTAIRDDLGADSTGGKLFTQGLGNVRDNLAAAVDAGVSVLAGTDLRLNHGAVASEAIALHQYGLTPAQVVHAMTGAAYEYLGTEQGFEPGQHADVAFFDRNPLEDLSVLADPVILVRRGTLLRNRLT